MDWKDAVIWLFRIMTVGLLLLGVAAGFAIGKWFGVSS